MSVAPATLTITQAGAHANVEQTHKVPASGHDDQPGYHTVDALKLYITSELQANVSTLFVSLGEVIDDLANLTADYTANLETLTDLIGDLDTRLDNLEIAVSPLDDRIANIESDVTTLETAISNVVNDLAGNLTSIGTRFTDAESNISALDIRLDAVEISFSFGDNTANAIGNSTLIKISNTSGTSNLSPGLLSIGQSLVNTSGFAVGNTRLDGSSVRFGNSTVNAYADALGFHALNPDANIHLTVPTDEQYDDAFTFLRSNSSWISIEGWFLANTQLSNDGTLSSNSDSEVPSVQAVKNYVDQLLGAQDALRYIDDIDCSTNPNYPAADRGAVYRIAVAGKIGGASGVAVEVGDTLLCKTDGTVSGNQATVGSHWNVTQGNIDGAVIGPASAVQYSFAQFSDTSGKLLQGGVTMDNDASLASNNSTRFPTQQAVKVYVDTLTSSLPLASQAANVYYSNTASGLASNNLQGALDLMVELLEAAIGVAIPAANVTYANGPGILANTVQDAIDYVIDELDSIPALPTSYAAANVSYANTGVHLSSANVQSAIGELRGLINGLVELPDETDIMTDRPNGMYILTDAVNGPYEGTWIYDVYVGGGFTYINATNIADGNRARTYKAGPTWLGYWAFPVGDQIGYYNTTGSLSATQVNEALNELAVAVAARQPLDADLTDIAALSTTSTGRSLLAAADAAAIRVIAGTRIGTDVQAYDAAIVKGPASVADGTIALYDGLTGKLLKASGVYVTANSDLSPSANTNVPTNWSVKTYADNTNRRTVALKFDFSAGGSVIPANTFIDLQVPFAGTIQSWTLLNDQSSNTTLNVWKDTYANFPPTNADSMTNSNDPATSSASKNSNNSLGSWTSVAIAADDIIRVNVGSNDTATKISFVLKVLKT